MPNRPLSDKRQIFVNEYVLNGCNLTQAYKIAYPDCNGGWGKLGHRLMKNDGVRLAVAGMQAEMKARFEGSIEQSVKDYEQARLLALTINQPAAAVSAIRWRDGLFGLQAGDKTAQERTIIVISPREEPKQVDSEVISQPTEQPLEPAVEPSVAKKE